MKKGNLTLGAILIGIGLLAVLNNLGITNYHFTIWKLWPLFLLIPGIIFELNYFNKNGPAGLLVPGGILTTYGLMFMYCSIVDWNAMGHIWPLFLGGVGIGLFQLYYFGGKAKALFYVSSGFLSFAGITIFFNLLSIRGNYVLPIILIFIGFLIIFSPKNNGGKPIITVEYENDDENIAEDSQKDQ